MPDELPDFHPRKILRDWSPWARGSAFHISDAQTGVISFGSTGSGKTSGPARHYGISYLANNFGGVVLCSKNDERPMWEEWARETHRTRDLIIIDKSAKWRCNFLEWEASRAGAGGGLTINIVALLDELAGAIASDAAAAGEGAGDNKFFSDALHHMNTNLVDICLLAEMPVSLPLMRAIVNTAPQSAREAQSDEWKHGRGECAVMLSEAAERTAKADEDTRADFEECETYWTQEWPGLSERTRSIVQLSFSMLVRPLITRPLRRLMSTDTNVTPEAAFAGKILIIDCPVQEYFLAGKIINLAWKFCFQRALLGRVQPTDGTYLRPCFLHMDEAQNFLTEYDTLWASLARSAGGCFSVMVQNRESMVRVLKSEAAVDSLLGNLQCQCFCQNSSVSTNAYASKLIGERYTDIVGITTGQHRNPQADDPSHSTGTSISEQKRYWLEPSAFNHLRRGGEGNQRIVDCIIYNGGAKFQGVDEHGAPALLPYLHIPFEQQKKEPPPQNTRGGPLRFLRG
jgi:hypothetical protein